MPAVHDIIDMPALIAEALNDALDLPCLCGAMKAFDRAEIIDFVVEDEFNFVVGNTLIQCDAFSAFLRAYTLKLMARLDATAAEWSRA